MHIRRRLIGFLVITTGRRSHAVRYVLRNRATGDAYLVIVFSLYLKEDVNEDGSLKPAALKARRGGGKLAVEEGDGVDEGGGERERDEKGEGEGGYSDDVD